MVSLRRARVSCRTRWEAERWLSASAEMSSALVCQSGTVNLCPGFTLSVAISPEQATAREQKINIYSQKHTKWRRTEAKFASGEGQTELPSWARRKAPPTCGSPGSGAAGRAKELLPAPPLIYRAGTAQPLPSAALLLSLLPRLCPGSALRGLGGFAGAVQLAAVFVIWGLLRGLGAAPGETTAPPQLLRRPQLLKPSSNPIILQISGGMRPSQCNTHLPPAP